MFGKRGSEGSGRKVGAGMPAATVSAPAVPAVDRPAGPEVFAEPLPDAAAPRQHVAPPARKKSARTELYYDTKGQVFSALIDTIDLSQLAKLDGESAREEIRDIVNDIITIKNFAMSISEQEDLLEDICNDVLGYGPL